MRTCVRGEKKKEGERKRDGTRGDLTQFLTFLLPGTFASAIFVFYLTVLGKAMREKGDVGGKMKGGRVKDVA